jgi:hypothetical protein
VEKRRAGQKRDGQAIRRGSSHERGAIGTFRDPIWRAEIARHEMDARTPSGVTDAGVTDAGAAAAAAADQRGLPKDAYVVGVAEQALRALLHSVWV